MGIGIAAAYAVCFLLLRGYSQDQWYLPAGLRVAVLLLFPYRYWPYLILGDVAAVLCYRTKLIPEHGMGWVVVSTVTMMPAAALVVYAHKRRIEAGRLHWYPSLTLLSALSVSAVNAVSGYFLATGLEPFKLENALRLVIGNYLGILVLTPLGVLYRSGNAVAPLSPNFWPNAIGAFAAVAALFAVAAAWPSLLPAHQHGLKMLMLIPAVALALLHGWRGVAVGVAMVDLAIGLFTMQSPAIVGEYDQDVFLTQRGFAMSATVLFGFCALITQWRPTGRHDNHRQQAIAIARSSLAASERELERRTQELTELGDSVRESYSHAARSLREHGHHEAAMAIQSDGVQRAREIRNQLTLLYPVEIRSVGLYGALGSGMIADIWRRNGKVVRSLRGDAGALSFDLQLAAYRTICDLVSLLQQTGHPHLALRVRCGQSGRWSYLAATITSADSDGAPFNHEFAMLETGYIASRVLAYGGVVHRREHRIAFMMREALGARASPIGFSWSV
ncbi:MASE1 domain-containing protein [Luteimonas gilva]|uniref:MASE1 domain-containing protein n=1 Tax=Luteimonas gilva TaxID=2572684 RepID=UPI001675619D|nr:MASE1 domain-containing protein [Luteimonas gilva]